MTFGYKTIFCQFSYQQKKILNQIVFRLFDVGNFLKQCSTSLSMVKEHLKPNFIQDQHL